MRKFTGTDPRVGGVGVVPQVRRRPTSPTTHKSDDPQVRRPTSPTTHKSDDHKSDVGKSDGT